MSRIYQALAYSLFSKYINRAIDLASVVLIARLLSPDELGIFAIAGTITLIAGELKSFGAGNYLIREPQIDKPMVRRALGLSMLLAWSVGFVLLAGSSSLGDYYDKDGLTALIQVMSLSFFMAPFISVGKALMSREFQFKKIFISESSSKTIQLISVLVFIHLGFSYMSLAYSSLLGFITELTLICLLRPKQFSVIPLFSGLRDIAKFGFYVTFSNLLRMVSINIPDLVIGKTGTSAEVAYFSRGMGLLSFLTMTINSGIQPVIAPYFANKNKKANQLNISYLRASMLMSAMTVPALAVAGYASVPLIDLFFGDQWAVSASVVSVLCYWSILRFLTSLSPSLLITTGHEKLLFYKELIMVIVNALAVYALYPSGLVAISAGLVVAGVIDLLVVILLLRFAVGITIVAHLKNLVPNVFLTITCVAWAAAVDQLITFNTASSILSIAVLGPTTFIIWMTSLYLIKHPFRIELNKLFSKILSKKA